MTSVEVLRAARAKIEIGWTQGSYARDKHGNRVSEISPLATCWCLLGACCAQFEGAIIINEHAVTRFLQFATGCSKLEAWNDTNGRTAGEVLSAFDRAIALEESEGT